MPAVYDFSQAQADINSSVKAYYTGKVLRWGPVARGVDWPDKLSQQLRYLQLLRIAADPLVCSWNELGCGYGAMLELIAERYSVRALSYCGVDLSSDMVAHAERAFGTWPGVKFTVGARCGSYADYTIASGIFNVQFGYSRALWEQFVKVTLADMFRASCKGMAVNFLRPTSKSGLTATDLYVTDPRTWVAFGIEKLGAVVELIVGYGLDEFTLRLRRPGV